MFTNTADVAPSSGLLRGRRRPLFIGGLLLTVVVAVGAVLFLMLPLGDSGGKINIISVPEGASVVFEGEALEKPTPVVIPVQDTTRTYSVEVRLPNYKDYKKTISFPEGDTSVMELAVLTQIFGKVHVSSKPEGADIYVEGEHRGKTPATIDNLTPTGEFSLELRKRGYRPVTESIKWEDKTELQKEFSLQRSR